MNYRMIYNIIGKVMKVEAAFLIIPLIIALWNDESTATGFAITIVLLGSLGFLMTAKKPGNRNIYAREGFVIVALSWVSLSIFGALPFFLSGAIPNYIDALFETISGFTTTGSTILTDIEALPNSLLFWRSFTHWIGGMGVLVFALAIIPKSDAQSMHVMRAEVPGPKVGKLVSKTMMTARILYGIYMALSVLQILLLWIGGMPLFDSVTTAFSTAGTGGFGILNASIEAYHSIYLESVITIFMLLFGINFNLFYLLLIKQYKQVFKSEELKYYLGIILGAVVLISINISVIYETFAQSLRYAGFQVVSIITTTGFTTADYVQWPVFSQLILVALTVFGACAGSTGGGITIARVIILVKSGLREIRRVLNPRSVMTVNMDGKPVEEEVVRGVNIFFVTHMMITALSCLLVSLDSFPFDITEKVSAVVASINNVGVGLGRLGPTGNYAEFSGFSQLILSFDMLVGRLEIYPVLILFMPSTWKRI